MGRGKSTATGLILEEHSGNGNSISGMPRQCPTQRDQRPARPAWPRLARRCVLACAFVALMAGGPALTGAGPATAAAAALARAGGAGTAAAAAQPVTVGITAVNPQVARPGHPVTVQGTVSNPTRAAVSGLTVQLRSSSTALTSRTALREYAARNLAADAPLLRAVARLPGTLAPGAVQDWTVTIPAGTLPLSTFGVYPLAAEVDSGGAALSTDHTFLPFWPGSKAAAGLTQRMKIAWIWPVFSAPEQAACPALLNNVLASSLTAGGRLGRLLAAGSTPEAVRAHLTWAIDPSVLSSAAVMRQAYQVGGTATCTGAVTKRGSPAARSWLARLRSVTAQQDYFVTPYADVDVSALTHAGLITDLQRAQHEGDSVAQKFLGGTQRPAVGDGGPIAWPAAGIADFGVLGSLAATGVSSVILNSSLMPPRTALLYTPSAITSALDGVDAGVHVALTDNILGQVLADGPTAAQARRAQARTQTASTQTADTVQATAAAG